ncbi:hypothetical protein JXA88_14005 [Candidatus Fermentibacteria bacterium]|nr:hypothetical protein [Candidatus Fermentibacteria bacterium]
MVILTLMACAVFSMTDMPAPLRDDFDSGRYQQMIGRVDSLLAQSIGLSLPELAGLHLWKGFGQAALGDRPKARASFGVALSLDPSIELDPREVSPKILSEFEAARALSGAEAEGESAAVYLVLEDSRPGAAFRSMLVPGWGQWTMGRKTRGVAFAAVGLSGLAGWVAAATWEDDTHARYLRATGGEISSAYDDYNRAHKIRRLLGYGVVAVWAGSVADVLLGPTVSVRVIGSGTSLGIAAGGTLH